MQTQRVELMPTPALANGYLISISRPGTPAVKVTDLFVMGRDLACHLPMIDAFASARHARIEIRVGRFVLRDLQSRNGTFLNGARIVEAILNPGDRIQIGETIYVFSEAPTTNTDLASKNKDWNEQLMRLPAFAKTAFPVLITGSSGTGKEILARALHTNSSRVRAPFIGINCSALSENLIESELFGHVRGSFTGASHDRKGAFEAARGGTLFLDEIGDLPLALQPKLLRALENNEIRPVGSDRTIETDVRIIAATHKDMPAAVATHQFREDLYYRLNVCQITPPNLTERLEDFDDLLYSFAKQYRVRFSFQAIARLKQHRWPGNIRELKNLVARASAYFPGHHIQPEDLDQVMRVSTTGPEVHYVADNTATKGSIIKEIEREMIVRRLIANKGNQRRTALELGLPKSTLHDRIKTYSIDLEKIALESER